MGAVFMIQCPVMTALLPGGYILSALLSCFILDIPVESANRRVHRMI